MQDIIFIDLQMSFIHLKFSSQISLCYFLMISFHQMTMSLGMQNQQKPIMSTLYSSKISLAFPNSSNMLISLLNL
jgi:hypothetical protein